MARYMCILYFPIKTFQQKKLVCVFPLNKVVSFSLQLVVVITAKIGFPSNLPLVNYIKCYIFILRNMRPKICYSIFKWSWDKSYHYWLGLLMIFIGQSATRFLFVKLNKVNQALFCQQFIYRSTSFHPSLWIKLPSSMKPVLRIYSVWGEIWDKVRLALYTRHQCPKALKLSQSKQGP